MRSGRTSSGRLRILHIEDEIWDSGIAHYALTLAAGLRDRGHDIHVWGQPGSVPCVQARELGLQVSEVSRPWLSLPRLRYELRRLGIELINAHTGSAHSLAAAAAAGLGIPVVRTRGDARLPTRHTLSRALARRTSAFIAPNSVIQGRLRAAYPGSRVDLVCQGLPAPPESPLASEPAVGIIGRLDPVKGHEDLIAAAADVVHESPSARFYVAGAGPAARDVLLRGLAAERGLDGKLSFLGFVPSVDRFMARCRIGVVASRGSEAVSRAALEWMSHGRPLVATRTGCLPDLVEDRESGLLVTPERPRLMAKALQTLLRDPERAADMGRRARALFLERFSLPRFVADTERIYLDLLHRLPS